MSNILPNLSNNIKPIPDNNNNYLNRFFNIIDWFKKKFNKNKAIDWFKTIVSK